MKVEEVARICHEANKALCESHGDNSQKPWLEAAEWQRDSAIKGVRFALANPEADESAQHDAWMRDKLAQGWIWGDTKDEAKKTHPCIVAYNQLPAEQRAKDYLFRAIVSGLMPFITN